VSEDHNSDECPWNDKHMSTNNLYFSDSNLSARADEALLQEVDIMRSLNPNSFEKSRQNLDDASVQDSHIIHVIDFYTSPTKYHIVMELARGGDVFDQLAKRRGYTEKDARDFARKMMLGIDFLHSRGIAHRDIKPENLLLMDSGNGSRLKLADFGFARRFDMDSPDDSMKTKCGTPAFVPPELVMGRKYGPKCDVWSAGCTLVNVSKLDAHAQSKLLTCHILTLSNVY
jgi:serine/threonine protein kinase